MDEYEKWARARLILNEIIWRKCEADPIFFIDNFATIKRPPDGVTRITLRPEQREIINVWHTNRMTVSLKARQIGWTTTAALYSLWVCLFQPGKNVIALSRGQEYARDLLAMAFLAYDKLPRWMQERSPLKSKTLEKMTFTNASQIQSLPSKKDPARGKTADVLFGDEFAFWDDVENKMPSILPVTEAGGSLHLLSSANGSGTAFERLYTRAKQGLNKFRAMFYGWDVVPGRDAQWYEYQRSNMEEWQLHQEYPADDIEAFIRSGNPVFNQDALIGIDPIEPAKGEIVRVAGDFSFLGIGSGGIEMFQEPQANGRYVIGADTARGLEFGDFNAACVLKIEGGAEPLVHVASFHDRCDPDLFGQRLLEMGYFYNSAFIGVESNNHGLTTLFQLRNENYPHLFYRRVVGRKKEKRTKELGWATTRVTKPIMMDELGSQIRSGQLNFRCGETRDEMRAYRRLEDGSMSGAPHDDRVVAFAIAVQMAAYAPKRFRPEASKGAEPGTMQWMLDMAKAEAAGPPKAGSFLEARRRG